MNRQLNEPRFGTKLFGDEYAYYFDLPFEETVRRHQTRSKEAEFGADEIVNEIYLRVCKE